MLARRAGLLTIGAGVVFFATATYLFTVLRSAGLTIDMFDNPAALLPWAHTHGRLYQGMWLLYFASQALLLCVPALLGGRATAVLGTAAVILAMVGLAVQYAASPVTAAAYHRGGGQLVLDLHVLVADIGKDLRLFSEVLLGGWLALVAWRLTGRVVRWSLVALGAWTVLVAGWKLVDPYLPLEDWLGFLLGLGYVVLGVHLMRRPPVAASAPAA